MKDKPTDLIERGTKAGCETVQDFAIWINGYENGLADLADKMTKTIPDEPDYSEIKTEYDGEEAQERIDKRERYADYSDKGDEK